jgi:hypothetical protein
LSRPVYSAAFIKYTPSTPNLAFLVPDGFTVVIRQISAVQNVGVYALGLYLQDDEAAPLLEAWAGESEGDFNVVFQEGRWVCPAGGLISVQLTEVGSSCSVYVGGYLLAD